MDRLFWNCDCIILKEMRKFKGKKLREGEKDVIFIGCTGFQEHGSLNGKTNVSLYEYGQYFPIVELDTSFYYIPQEAHIKKWLTDIPENFQFILKVPGLFTTHRPLAEDETFRGVAHTFCQRLAPMIDQGRLFCLLAQFPASFTCTRENVTYLMHLRQWFPNEVVAIEFRHASWYDKANIDKMHAFMKQQRYSLVVADEPKKIASTVPLDFTVTNSEAVLIRLHGRNDAGWVYTGPDARAYRTLYDYHTHELADLAEGMKQCQKETVNVAVIFNNNSGGHAAVNAKQLQSLLHIDYSGLHPNQMDLF